MIEKIVVDYLDRVLEVSAYSEMPKNPPDRFVIVDKTGSSEENHICSATFALQSYAKTLYEAAALNEEVKKAMDKIIELDMISSSKLNTDYPFTDTTKKQYRYQAVYDLVY